MGIGIVILVLVLSVGLPTINRIRDKNTASESQDVMLTLDKNIREVYSEGPGSKRTSKIEIKRGDFKVDEGNELITWDFETTVLLTEPNITIRRGSLQITTTPSKQAKRYQTLFLINYTDVVDLQMQNPQTQFSGSNTILITNIGIKATNKVPTILIETI